MVAAVATAVVPKYFPESLDLPLPPDHKTWHTERLCPTLLAQALGSERLAMFIAQLHYWLQKEDVGIKKHGWQWIYNTEWEWREQFPWMSEHTMGRVRRKLEQLGYVVSNDFNRNPLDRTKHSTLDYYRLAVETGWNPMGVDLNRDYPQPPQFTKGMKQRGRHKSDSVPLVYKPVEPEQPESLEPPKEVDSAQLQNASCTIDTIHSAQLQVSSIYKEIPNTSKSNQETDLKIEPEKASGAVGQVESRVVENATHPNEEHQQASDGVTQSSSQSQSATPASLDSDEDIKVNQQLVASLNATLEQQDLDLTQHRQLKSKPIRIPELDEDAHEILWKYQETLLQLNVDLHASRLIQAIVDNPQHLEDAIRAFQENSAIGAKTPEAATGFLYNALRNGWKPRQCSSAHVSVQVYTPPQQMLEAPKPPSLEELVAHKRVAWHNAIILRPSIEAWVEQTAGVIMTNNGPVLADTTNQQCQIDSEPKAASPQVTKAATNTHPPQENATPPKLDPLTRCEVTPDQDFKMSPPQLEGNSAVQAASNSTQPPSPPAASAAVPLPNFQSPSTPPIAKPKPPDNRRLQPVDVLTQAGAWIAGYFVHSCIAVANLVGIEQKFTLFDADGGAYIFFGQIRPPCNT